jgi:DNA-binding transcriptional ArsR family regulator
MVTNHPDFDERRLDRVFAALADSTRRAIVVRLARSEATVGELAEPFPVSRPAISKHLDVLERAGLVRRIPDGRVNRCRFDREALAPASEWVEWYRRDWEGRLDALAAFLETEVDGDGTEHRDDDDV